MDKKHEGNIVDLVDKKYKEKTWSIQIRVDPCALAELALYFDREDGTVRTKSMLGAVIVETLRMVLRDNKLLGESVTDPLRAMEIFNELGYTLQAGGRFARSRIHKTLVVREDFIKRIDMTTGAAMGVVGPLDHVDVEMDQAAAREMDRVSRGEGKTDPDELAAEQEAIDKEQVEEMRRALAVPTASDEDEEETDG